MNATSSVLGAFLESSAWGIPLPYLPEEMRADVADIIAYTQRKNTIDQVLDTLLQPIHHSNGPGAERSTVYDVWVTIVKAAEKTPQQNQDRLLQLCEALKCRKIPIDDDTKRNWQLRDDELEDEERPPPFLGAIIREELDIVSNKSEEFINLCSFSAYLTIYKSTNSGNYSLHGLWMIREALEEHNSIEELVLHQSITSIQAARIWLQIAGSTLYKASLANEEYAGKMGIVGKGARAELHDNIKGFSIERWQFWHSRLESICKNIQTEESMRQECKMTLQAMESAKR
ncbi:hypothetical protein L7F22_003255 [Adiantum nelumboides]|nr:hypothetical protein [Adiantum nelumboides]